MSNEGLQPQAGIDPKKIEGRVSQVLRRFRIGLEHRIANGQLPHGKDLGPYIDSVLDDWITAQDRDIIKHSGAWAVDQMVKQVKKAVQKAKVKEGLRDERFARNGWARGPNGALQRTSNPGGLGPQPGAPQSTPVGSSPYDNRVAGAPKVMPEVPAMRPQGGMRSPTAYVPDAHGAPNTMPEISGNEQFEDSEEIDGDEVDEASGEIEGDEVDEASEEIDGDEVDEDKEVEDECDEKPVKESEALATRAGGKGDGVKRGDGRRHNTGQLSPPKLASGTPVKGQGESPKGGKGGGGKGTPFKNYGKPGYGSGRVKNQGGTTPEHYEGKPLKGLKEYVGIVAKMMSATSPRDAAEVVVETVGQKKAEVIAEAMQRYKLAGKNEFHDSVMGKLSEDDADLVRLRKLMKRK